ncbi:MAG TPA: hypothetical protein VFE96_02960 [Candidatus Bathyarchaeia archaeon]|jgi:hypothetical protein|nr:hypothetical protein [Candidatus Bathyarchaeia archaeon]
MLSEARCYVCGAKFKQGDHVYEKIKEELPWETLTERLRGESLDLAGSMSVHGPASMGTYHKLLVVSETLQAISSKMQLTARQQSVKP